MNIISLGAGVQSTTVFLMSCLGELPKADVAIFADTGWEPKEVYEHVGNLASIGAISGIPVFIRSRGNIRADALRATVRGLKTDDRGRAASMPLYTSNNGQIGMIRRQCTREYKLDVINAFAREVAGVQKGKRYKSPICKMWIGISSDEAARMRDSAHKWAENWYPLIFGFDYPLSRRDCEIWLTTRGYAVPRKSACLGCPFHSDAEWRQIKANPEEWADVVEFDAAIRQRGGMRGELFLHRSGKPLDEVDFSTAEKRGQLNWLEERGQLNWLNECLGMCGV